MKEHKLFSVDQHGFLPNKSCITQLLIIIEHWTKIIDEGYCIDNIYLDFSKAFDSVPHERLLLKLRILGLSELTIKWFTSFLGNRTQRVCIEGEYSNWVKVTSGVRQGRVLGPILFLIYINDLPDAVNSFVKNFADDTKLYNTANSDEDCEKLQNSINDTSVWANLWQLPFNADKCKVIHFGRNNPETNYTIPNSSGTVQNLTTIDEEKDLGVFFDKKLTFNNHINHCVKKANQMLGLIKRNFTALDPYSFTQLYKALVRSHLEYGNVIWRPHYRKDILKLEKIQKRATKCIKSISHLTYEERLKFLKLPTLEYRRARGDMIQTYKII
jgi:hypothetical protein